MKKGNIIVSVLCAILGITVIAIASGYPTAADYGTGVPGPGLSAIDNASEDPATGSSTPETPDTSGGGEDLMRQMF